LEVDCLIFKGFDCFVNVQRVVFLTARVKFLGRHLMVKGRFADLILSGRKKTTIRLGHVIPRYEEVIVHGHGRPLCKVRIRRVTYKRVKELTDDDALKDGFNGLAELLRALKETYGDISPDMEVTIIEFNVEKMFTDVDYSRPYMGLDPVDVARLGLRYLRKELPQGDVRVLEEVARTGSLREATLRLHKSLSLKARRSVRRVIRRVLKILVERGLLGSDFSRKSYH